MKCLGNWVKVIIGNESYTFITSGGKKISIFLFHKWYCFKSKNIVTVMVVVVGSGDYNRWAKWFPKNCQSAGLILVQGCFLVLERDRGSCQFWTQNGPSQLSSTLETWPKWIPSGAQNPVQNSNVPLEYLRPCKSTLFKPKWLFHQAGGFLIPVSSSNPNTFTPFALQFPSVTCPCLQF